MDQILIIKDTYFFSNNAEFGGVFMFENKEGIVNISNCYFNSQSNPMHPVGTGTLMNIVGNYLTKVYFQENLVKNSFSVGYGQFGLFYGQLYDINTTYESIIKYL